MRRRQSTVWPSGVPSRRNVTSEASIRDVRSQIQVPSSTNGSARVASAVTAAGMARFTPITAETTT